jgi:hypothetical protein
MSSNRDACDVMPIQVPKSEIQFLAARYPLNGHQHDDAAPLPTRTLRIPGNSKSKKQHNDAEQMRHVAAKPKDVHGHTFAVG